MKKTLLILLFLACNTAHANENKVSLTPVQLYNLGVKMDKLKSIQDIPLLNAPAKVVIPPSQEYIVSTAQAGLISKLNVAIGDEVEKNQILSLIKSPELLSLQRQYLKSHNEKKLAWASYQRNEKLVKEGIISDRRWQENRNQYYAYSSAENEAKQLLEIAGMSAKEIKKLVSTRKLSSELTIRSPIKGVILDRMSIAGERLDVLAPIYKIANLDQLWLEINIPQEQLATIKITDKVKIDNTTISATISLLGQSVNPQTQTVLARAIITEKKPSLRAGQNVNVQIIQTSNQPTFIVPHAAVAQSEGKAYLFIRNNEGFTVSPVTIIGKQKQNSIITGTSALKENIEIAIRGAVALKASWLGLGGDE